MHLASFWSQEQYAKILDSGKLFLIYAVIKGFWHRSQENYQFTDVHFPITGVPAKATAPNCSSQLPARHSPSLQSGVKLNGAKLLTMICLIFSADLARSDVSQGVFPVSRPSSRSERRAHTSQDRKVTSLTSKVNTKLQHRIMILA